MEINENYGFEGEDDDKKEKNEKMENIREFKLETIKEEKEDEKEEEVFGFGSLLDENKIKNDSEIQDIKNISNKIVDNIIEKARNENNLNKDIEDIEDIEEKNELSIKEELIKLQDNNDKLKSVLEKVNNDIDNNNVENTELNFRPRKPKRKRRPKRK